jgi:hypothetical protein
MKPNTLLEDLQETHNYWKSGKKTLRWWKNETGYYGCNIRRLCKISIPHPSSTILIDYVYLLQLDYVIRVATSKRAQRKAKCFRKEVLDVLKLKLKEKGISINEQSLITTATS